MRVFIADKHFSWMLKHKNISNVRLNNFHSQSWAYGAFRLAGAWIMFSVQQACPTVDGHLNIRGAIHKQNLSAKWVCSLDQPMHYVVRVAHRRHHSAAGKRLPNIPNRGRYFLNWSFLIHYFIVRFRPRYIKLLFALKTGALRHGDNVFPHLFFSFSWAWIW